jgi:hypothetical protein
LSFSADEGSDGDEDSDRYFQAVNEGDLDSFIKLIPKCGLKIKDNHGRTALHLAAKHSHVSIVEKILSRANKYGLSINVRDDVSSLLLCSPCAWLILLLVCRVGLLHSSGMGRFERCCFMCPQTSR